MGIARMRNNGQSIGTAFFLGDRYVLTAFHCLESEHESGRVAAPVIELMFPRMPPLVALVIDWDVSIDVAILWIRDQVDINAQRMILSDTKIHRGTRFTARGYPQQSDDYKGSPELLTISGEIDYFPDRAEVTERIQMSCTQAAASQALLLSGMSGAPVLVGPDGNEDCVGILIWNMSSSARQPATGGICGAVPMKLVLARWPELRAFTKKLSVQGHRTNVWHDGNRFEKEDKTRDFVGRGDERAQIAKHFAAPKTLAGSTPNLDQGGTPAAQICIIHGCAGSGKTSLAYQVVADLAASSTSSLFINGWLTVNAGGFDLDPPSSDHSTKQMRPEEIFTEFLYEIGGTALRPDSAHGSTLRRHLGDREVLLLIDNISNYQVLKELRTINASCGIVVTSRIRPPLEIAEWKQVIDVPVGRLSTENGMELCTRGLVSRQRDPRSVRSIVADFCGGLPLAIKMTHGILIAHPEWTSADLLKRFRESQPLSFFGSQHPDEISLRRSFSASYEVLEPQLRVDFCLLGSLPSTGFSEWAATILLPIADDPPEARIAYLANVHLLERPIEMTDPRVNEGPSRSSRYQFHDLIWEYANQLLMKRDAGNRLDRDLVDGHLRLARFYVAAAGSALRRVFVGSDEPVPSTVAEVAENVNQVIAQDPIGWLSAERLSIVATAERVLAADEGGALVSEMAMLLAQLSEYFPVEAREQERYARVLDAGIATAHADGRAEVEGELHFALARLKYLTAGYVQTKQHLDLAIDKFAYTRAARREASARVFLGDTLRELGEWREAQHEFEKALDHFATTAMDRKKFEVYPRLGRVFRYLGEWNRARQCFDDAVAGLVDDASVHARRARAIALHDLGDLLRDQGQLDLALSRLCESEEISKIIGDELLQAHVVSSYVDVYRDMGEWEEAAQAFRKCDPVLEKYSDTRWRGRTHLNYAMMFRYRRLYNEAMEETLIACHQLTGIRDPKGHAMCDEALGAIEIGLAVSDGTNRLAHLAQAKQYLDAALSYFSSVNEFLWTAKCTWDLARLSFLEGELQESRRYADDSVAACARLGAVSPSTYEPLPDEQS